MFWTRSLVLSAIFKLKFALRTLRVFVRGDSNTFNDIFTCIVLFYGLILSKFMKFWEDFKI